MGLISNLFGKEPLEDPWVSESIYRLIESRIDRESGKLPEFTLPDEENFYSGKGAVRWAAGAWDGVGSHHMGRSESKSTAKKIAKLLDDIARTGDREAQNRLYPLLVEESVIGLVDDVIERLGKRGTPIEPHLSGFAARLATESGDRGPVKLGIALLGVMGLSVQESVVRVLGHHEEFTLYAAVALSNMLEEPELALWELAKAVDGWGRIETVERLVPTDNSEIRYWLRTEGYRNSIMYEYLTHLAAVHGHLAAALAQERIPDDELESAGEIITGLITGNGGPAAGMDAYDDAAAVCQSFLERVSRQSPQLGHFLTAHKIREYVNNDKREDADRLKNGWTEVHTRQVLELLSQYLDSAEWQDVVNEGLASEDQNAFHAASRAAEYLNIDTFNHHWERLTANPESWYAWLEVMRRANDERIDQIVRLATETIPLKEVATGPGEELGLGLEFSAHSRLDSVVQDLGRFPGKGWNLIYASLRSPVIHNRNMALNAIEGWGRACKTPESVAALRAAFAEEPVEEIKERIGKILRDFDS